MFNKVAFLSPFYNQYEIVGITLPAKPRIFYSKSALRCGQYYIIINFLHNALGKFILQLRLRQRTIYIRLTKPSVHYKLLRLPHLEYILSWYKQKYKLFNIQHFVFKNPPDERVSGKPE